MNGDNPYDADVEKAEEIRAQALKLRAEEITQQRIERYARLDRANNLLHTLVRPELELVEAALQRRGKKTRMKEIAGVVTSKTHIDPWISLEIIVETEGARVVVGPRVWFTTGGDYRTIHQAFTLRAQMPNNFGDVFPDASEKLSVDDLTQERIRALLRVFVTSFFR